MEEKSWYYADGDQAIGPFFREELAERLADLQGSDTLVHGPGLSDWRPAGEVPELTAAALKPPERPLAALWLVYLLFRPRVFFRSFVLESAPGLTALCAWVYGVTGAIDWLEQRALVSEDVDLPDTWGIYWAFALIVGTVAGLGYFAIGGWWYAVRLGWSGVNDPDRALARRVYLFASQVIAIPGLAASVYDSLTYDTPTAATYGEGGLWYSVLLVFPIWSCWNSYVGVRTAFVVRRGAALMWFLVLPSLFYSLFLIGAVVLLVLGAFSGPAAVEHPKVHDTPGLHFSYPGNWYVNEFDEAHDPNNWLTVEPFGSALFRIAIYESDKALEEELEVTIGDFESAVAAPQHGTAFSAWGRYAGVGRVITGDIEGDRFRLRAFVGALPDGRLIETHELYEISIDQDVVPGFELIRSTCRVRE